MFKSATEKMEDQLFDLKFTAKSMAREATRAEKASKEQKTKCKKAMEKGNLDGARIHAESAIREKNQAANYLRLSSRIDAVAQRVQTAINMKKLTKSMSGIVKNMGTVMKSMDPVKISNVMDQFEKQFEDLDVTTKFMDDAMTTQQAMTTPESEVDGLMQQVADEHGLEFETQMDGIGKNKEKKKEEHKDEENDLEARLKKLQNQ